MIAIVKRANLKSGSKTEMTFGDVCDETDKMKRVDGVAREG
jgi:hypothetical protein